MILLLYQLSYTATSATGPDSILSGPEVTREIVASGMAPAPDARAPGR